MANLKLRYSIVIILLAVTALVVSTLQYDSSGDEAAGLADLQKIPMQIGNWKGQDLPLDESVYEILETRAILHRNYTDNKGHAILLSIVYYHDTKMDFHTPEGCLGGRGRKTTKTTKRIILNIDGAPKTIDVAEVVAASNGEKIYSYYFYKAGGFVGQNYINMRFNIAKNQLSSQNTSGALIRVTSASTLTDEEIAVRPIVGFLTAIYPFVEKEL